MVKKIASLGDLLSRGLDSHNSSEHKPGGKMDLEKHTNRINTKNKGGKKGSSDSRHTDEKLEKWGHEKKKLKWLEDLG